MLAYIPFTHLCFTWNGNWSKNVRETCIYFALIHITAAYKLLNYKFGFNYYDLQMWHILLKLLVMNLVPRSLVYRDAFYVLYTIPQGTVYPFVYFRFDPVYNNPLLYTTHASSYYGTLPTPQHSKQTGMAINFPQQGLLSSRS